MRFKLLLSKILPVIGKKTILTELDRINDTIQSYTLPAVESFNTIVIKDIPKGKLAPELEKLKETYMVANRTKDDYFLSIEKALNNALAICNYIEGSIDSKFNEDITRATLNAYTANILQLIQCLAFFADYSRQQALYLTALQTNHMLGNGLGIVKAQVDFLNKHKHTFNACLRLFTLPFKEIIDNLERLPDIILNGDNVDQVNSMTNIDPLKMGLISPSLNPAMFIGSKIIQYQAKKYKQAEADLKEVQCRLMKLKHAKDGKEDAKLDKQIEYYNNLNTKLQSEIDSMESSYGIKD